MINAVLIDDELNSLNSLEMELGIYCPNVNVQNKFNDPEKALAYLKKESTDLVFLDIEMPNLNGFELLQKLDNISFDLIFVTAYDQFAVKAFNFNAIDYVLKPIRKTKLIQAVNKVVNKSNPKIGQTDLMALLQNMQFKANPIKLNSIALPTAEGFKMVEIKEIIYLQADSNYTHIHVTNKIKYLVSRTLKECTEMLDETYFYRTHKSYLVNLNYIDRYVRGQGGYLILKDGTQITVARSQKAGLMKLLNLKE
jgi:two-component system LytT family response regulator